MAEKKPRPQQRPPSTERERIRTTDAEGEQFVEKRGLNVRPTVSVDPSDIPAPMGPAASIQPAQPADSEPASGGSEDSGGGEPSKE